MNTHDKHNWGYMVQLQRPDDGSWSQFALLKQYDKARIVADYFAAIYTRPCRIIKHWSDEICYAPEPKKE